MNAELIRTLEQVQARVLTERPEILADAYGIPADQLHGRRHIGASQLADLQPATQERAA